RSIEWERFGPFVFDPSRQSEVGHQGLAPGIEEDVPGLEVAVDEALLVDVMDRTGDLGHEPGDLLLSPLDGLLLRGRCGGRARPAGLRHTLLPAAPPRPPPWGVERDPLVAPVVKPHKEVLGVRRAARPLAARR